MDRRPIGVFDSGLGGLTAVRELTKRLPNESIIYFGDTGRVPYGPRGRDVIIKYASQDVNFLRTFDIKAILVACGTVSTTALDTLQQIYDMPLTGVVESASAKAARSTKNGRIGVIATSASIASGAYSRVIHTIDPSLTVIEKACPLFVPIVENGRFSKGDPLPELLVRDYLTELKALDVDTLVLGCTHYPLLWDVISDFMGEGVTLVSSGAEAAEYIAAELQEKDLLTDTKSAPNRYYVSDSTETFRKFASMYLQRDLDGDVEKVDIDKY